MELSALIKQCRGTRTMEAFGAEFGVTRQAVSQWENGTVAPNSKRLRKMGIVANFSPIQSVPTKKGRK